MSKPSSLIIFLFTAVIILLGRMPVITAPPWDIDEGIYATIGQALRSGELLYVDVWDNKPPGIYFLYDFISRFSSSYTAPRYVATFFLILTSGALFYLAKRVYSGSTALWVLGVFSFLAIVPLLETHISNAEIFFLLPTTLAVLLTFLIEFKSWSRRWYLGVGALLGVGFLFKTLVVFDGLAILSLLIFKYGLQSLKDLRLIILGGLLVLIVPAVYLVSGGLTDDFIRAAFLNNFGYVKDGNQTTVSFIDISNPVITVGGKILALGLAIWTIRRRFRSKVTPITLFYLWLVWTIFGALLSGRPYLHYLIASMGAATLLIPTLVGSVWPWSKIRDLSLRSWAQGLGVVAALSLALILGFGGKIQLIVGTPELARYAEGYYSNAYFYLSGQISQKTYFDFYGEPVTLNLKLRDYVLENTNPTDRIYIWGNAPWVYFLTGRQPAAKYVVAYHLTFVKEAMVETLNELTANPPELVIVTNEPSYFGEAGSPTPKWPEFNQYLIENFDLKDRVGQADIFIRKGRLLAGSYE